MRPWLAVLLFACAAPPAARPAQPAAAQKNGHAPPPAAVAARLEPPAPTPPPAAEEPAVTVRPLPAPKTAAPPPDPKVVARAKTLVARGIDHYSRGEYERAEEVLREAVLLYPFLPEANLVLGKVFLIRGSATRDRAMVNSARLMLEMAFALNPELREAAVLLELFQAAAPE